MKIAIITELFHPHIGGMEVRHKELGQVLIAQGHEISVYTLRLSPADKTEDAVDGIRIHRITEAYHYLDSIWGMRNYPDVVRFTADLLTRKKELKAFDAILFNIWPVVPAMVVPSWVKAKCIIDWCEIYQDPLWGLIYRALTLKKNILHSAITRSIADILQATYKVPMEKIRVVLSGVHSGRYFCLPEEKQNKTILYVGRLFKHKNVELLIRSFLHGDLEGKGYRLDIVGNGPLYEDLKNKYHAKNGVFLHGAVDEARKVDFIKRSSLFVLPSKREGFGIVCAEAASAGTPTLIVDYPDNRTVDVVRQFGIGWVSSPEIQELCDKIEWRGDMENKDWGSVSRKCVEAAAKSFDWNRVAAEFINFIKGVTCEDAKKI